MRIAKKPKQHGKVFSKPTEFLVSIDWRGFNRVWTKDESKAGRFTMAEWLDIARVTGRKVVLLP